MCELYDFQFFKNTQLFFVDFSTGVLDTIRTVNHAKTGKPYQQRRLNVGSLNEDGYQRVWCNGTLRMKHRLLYWLYHNELPIEVDHMDRNRNNNNISNLRPATRSLNNSNCGSRNNRFRFTDMSIRQVCDLLANTSESDQTIANKVGCSRVAVREIKIRENHINISKDFIWSHRGY